MPLRATGLAAAAAQGGAVAPSAKRRWRPILVWERAAERQVREAMARGEFDDLPGAGLPIADIDQPHDDQRWLRDKLRREQVSYLPPTLALRKEIEGELDAARSASSEQTVRDVLARANRTIRDANRRWLPGPPHNLVPYDVDAFVAAWRSGKGGVRPD